MGFLVWIPSSSSWREEMFHYNEPATLKSNTSTIHFFCFTWRKCEQEKTLVRWLGGGGRCEMTIKIPTNFETRFYLFTLHILESYRRHGCGCLFVCFLFLFLGSRMSGTNRLPARNYYYIHPNSCTNFTTTTTRGGWGAKEKQNNVDQITQLLPSSAVRRLTIDVTEKREIFFSFLLLFTVRCSY
jgi:hypothetical protein